MGALLGLRWAGGGFSGNGKIELSGYSADDLSASAKGDLHFDWRNGAMGNQPSAASKADPVPAALGRFDRFTADASIANGTITLARARSSPVPASALSMPPSPSATHP